MNGTLVRIPTSDISELSLEPIDRSGFDMSADTPGEYGRVCFMGTDGGFASGIWRGEAGTIPLDGYPTDELCLLIDGEVVLTDETGKVECFVKGEAFVVRKGFRGTWHMPVASTKIFASYGSPAELALLLGIDEPVRNTLERSFK